MKIVLTSFVSALVIVCAPNLYQRNPREQVVRASQESWKRILSVENEDLQRLDSANREKLVSFLRRVVPHVSGPPPFRTEDGVPPFHGLLYLWKLENPNEPARVVIVGADGLFMIPGDSRAEAFVFDLEGNLISYTEFSLGWRAQFENVSLIRNDEIGVPLIKFLTNRVDLGSEQYYALIGDSLSLIRLEGEGKPVRNKFVAENWTIGPRVPEGTSEEWENTLRSSNPGEVLKALMWIGGKHWDLKIPPHVWDDGYTSPTTEVRKNAESVVSVRLRPSVQQRLKELRDSGSKWITEAAELALHPHDGDTSFCCGYASQ